MSQSSSEYARACPSAATSTQECCEFTPLALRWLALIRQCREARPHRPPAGKIPSRRGADRHEEPPNTRWASERRELERSSSLCFLHWADSLPQDKLSPRGQAEARNLQHVHARGSKRPSRAASSRDEDLLAAVEEAGASRARGGRDRRDFERGRHLNGRRAGRRAGGSASDGGATWAASRSEESEAVNLSGYRVYQNLRITSG